MDTAVAPVSLKGTREPLLLVATGFFMSLAWTPLTGMIGAAGIALGVRELRKCDSASVLGRSRGICEIAAWCTCALWISSFTAVNLLFIELITQPIALCAAATVLVRLARASGANRLARVILYLGWFPPVFPLLVLMGSSFPQVSGFLFAAAMLVHGVVCLSLAVSTLQLRTRALPYGKRPLKGSHA